MIYLTKPYFDNKEIDAVKKTFESGWVAGQGPKNKDLAEFVCSLLHVKYAIPVNNCTAGLHLALLAMGIQKEDEVLVSDYTFPATGHAVMYCGAKPIFIDVSLSSYNMDYALIEKKLTKKTKAIIVVHALGQMADMDRILFYSHKHHLKVIEDAACAMGAKYKGKVAGTIGDIGVFSFHARKNATSGEGGIVVTNNKKCADLITSLACFGMESAYSRQHDFSIPTFTKLGYNYKLSDINASIVLEQLKKYPKILDKKRELATLYNRLLKENPYVTIPKEEKYNLHVYQTYAVVLNKKINRNKIIISLKNDGIQSQIGTYSSHIQPVYKSKDKCPNSLFLFHHSLALPLYYQMKREEVHYVVNKLNYHISKQRKNT